MNEQLYTPKQNIAEQRADIAYAAHAAEYDEMLAEREAELAKDASTEEYMAQRPVIDENGHAHSPENGGFVGKESYFDNKREDHFENTNKSYEEMSLDELNTKLDVARANEDKTMANDLHEAISEKHKDLSMLELAKQLARAEVTEDEVLSGSINDKLVNKIEDYIENGLTTKNGFENSNETPEDLVMDRVIAYKDREVEKLKATPAEEAPEEPTEEYKLPDQEERPEAEQPAVETTSDNEAETANNEVKLAVGEVSKEKRGEDVMLRNDEDRLYAVFDGAGGGGGNAKAAAQAAADGIQSAYDQLREQLGGEPEFGDVESAKYAMSMALDLARQHVSIDGEGGTTTATILKVEVINGITYGIWANAGDSRIYIENDDYEINQITKDQSAMMPTPHGMQPTLFNGLGHNYDGSKDEIGAVVLTAGDRIMICSDGITGDTPEQELSLEEMMGAFDHDTPQASAEKFLEISKKSDDKSVFIIDVEEAPEAEDFEEEDEDDTEAVVAEEPTEEMEAVKKTTWRERAKLLAGEILSGNFFAKNKDQKTDRRIAAVAAGIGLIAAAKYLDNELDIKL